MMNLTTPVIIATVGSIHQKSSSVNMIIIVFTKNNLARVAPIRIQIRSFFINTQFNFFGILELEKCRVMMIYHHLSNIQ